MLFDIKGRKNNEINTADGINFTSQTIKKTFPQLY